MLKPWKTRLSQVDSALMTNLGWGDALVIAVDYIPSGSRQRSCKIVFDKGPAYRTLAADIAAEYFATLGATQELGRSFIIEESAWIAELAAASPTFKQFDLSKMRHYVLMTNEYAVEIL